MGAHQVDSTYQNVVIPIIYITKNRQDDFIVLFKKYFDKNQLVGER